MAAFTDNELVVRLRRDDISAFDMLYHQYHQAVYANVIKLTRNETAAKDILQEVFVCLWEKRLVLDEGRPVSAWLFVISYNKSVTYLKKQLRESLLLKNQEAPAMSDDTDPALEETRARLLHEAIGRLSPQKQQVFRLCKMQGKTYEETARELSISRYTVKEYLAAAVEHIRQYIRNHPDYRSAFSDTMLLLLAAFLHP